MSNITSPAGTAKPLNRVGILAATILGSSMVFIDGTVVNVASPVLQGELNASAGSVQWVVEAYTLFLAALILVGGSLGDIFGRKRIFIAGTLFFALASVWCGLAPDINQLIFARAVQGIGGALLTPGSLAIITAAFPEKERGKAIGTWSGASSITAALGPVLGGWLVENASWRWVFFINVPLALLTITLALRFVPESHNRAAKNLDIWGVILVTIGLGTLTYGLIESSALGWTNPAVLAALAIGGVGLIAFVVVESRISNPMMPLRLFRSRNFTGTNLLTLLLYAALGGGFYFIPFNLIQVQNYGATAAGAALLPFILIVFLLSRWAGGLVVQYGAKLPLIVGPTIAGFGFALFALPGVGGSYWVSYFPAAIVMGIGMVITIAPLTTTVMGSVDSEEAGIASGINNAVSRTAGLFAVAVLGLVLFSFFSSSLDSNLAKTEVQSANKQVVSEQREKLAEITLPASVSQSEKDALKKAIDEAYITGFRMVMFVSAGLAWLSALVALLMIGESKSQAAVRKEEKAA